LRGAGGDEAISDIRLLRPFGARNDDLAANQGKFGYIYTIKSSLPLTDTHTLEATILILENKQSRTDIEESILQVTRAVIEDSAYIDKDTLNQFTKAIEVIRTIEGLKGVMNQSDFDTISKGLLKLLEEQHSIYNDYLKSTKNLYEKLRSLLGLLIEDESLPESYTPLYSVSILAKKKIAIDLAIERLKAKNEFSLTDNEKQALNINQYQLSPLREEYISKLKMAITSFTWNLRDIIKDKGAVSISSDASSLRALFLLDSASKNLNQAAQ